MTRNIALLLRVSALAAALATGLSACVPLVVGGAAVGAMVATDRRTSGAQLEDESIEFGGASRLRDAFGDRVHININSYNRQVLLTGEVPTAQDKTNAEQIIARMQNVKSVVNELAVMGQTGMQGRSNDTLITGKVKASLVDAKDLQVNAFKVVTERGTVYLMGRVSPREADRATQITRTISGVQRVVRIFEILSDQELQRLSREQAVPASRPAASTPAP
ncbi:BON domain-containing protein [uncultured Ramlibacter sp.]|uniref:BON domain-containing protein n=1 Tax=uncultured Ramlibacter sp. TaxID=260755 RepID=UPI002604E591|nr:BON domain-containing protein [uncultured Ramlibacter sp.]